MSGALERIAAARILPVVRTARAREAREIVERLVAGGLEVVELTTTIDGWGDLARALRAQRPELCLGIGTVTDAATAAGAVEAGADFAVTPFPVPGARVVFGAAGVPLLEGGFTPAEVIGAAERGVAKLFPAHVGGVAYLRSLRAIAPDARIVPTGGIALEDAAAWLDAGAFAVGIGNDLATGDVAARVRGALGG